MWACHVNDSACVMQGSDTVVVINVGGTLFTAALSTLRHCPDSFLGSLFSGRHQILRDKDGHPFVDADPERFRYILEYLRTEALPPEDLALDMYKMASYFSVEPLRERLLQVPAVAAMVTKELRHNRFGNYDDIKQRVIKLAIERASADSSYSGHVNVLVKLRHGNLADAAPAEHKCVRDAADLQKDYDDARDGNFCADRLYDEQLVNCIHEDLTETGFTSRISFSVCVVGCPCAVAKITIQF